MENQNLEFKLAGIGILKTISPCRFVPKLLSIPIERSGCCTDPHPDEPSNQAKKAVSEQDYA